MHALVKLIAFATWVAGIVIAKGFWSTLIAVFIPFWAWYLTIEQLIIKFL